MPRAPRLHRQGRRAYLREIWNNYACEPAQPCEYLGVEPVRSCSPDGIFEKQTGTVKWPRALITVEIPKKVACRTFHPNDPRRRHFEEPASTCIETGGRCDTGRKPRVTQVTKLTKRVTLLREGPSAPPPAPAEATTPPQR